MPAEFEGKTLAQAIENACQATGLDKDNLTYEVIHQGTRGIFGLVGARKARIRLTLPAEAPTPAATANALIAAMPQPPFPETNAVADERPDATQTAQRADAARRLGAEALQRMVDAITEGATVESQIQNGRLFFSIRGGNLGLLIGKRGQTLEAIQHLADKIINRGNADRVWIDVDVEGYLEKRGRSLKDMAVRLAAKTRHSGKPVTLEPMNAYERRIIHMALKSDTTVRTQSVGDGEARKLIIYPRGTAPQPGRAGTKASGSAHSS